MPLITESRPSSPSPSESLNGSPPRRHTVTGHVRSQSQHSGIAKTLLMSKVPHDASGGNKVPFPPTSHNPGAPPVSPPEKRPAGDYIDGVKPVGQDASYLQPQSKPLPVPQRRLSEHGVGAALTDTPATSTAPSPRMQPVRSMSNSSTPRMRPTTLDIPGLTKSKVSPDGRIASRDVGSKLVIVMVGLPARGKSYITKKLARYLNWLQHDTKIFNVGERRREAAGSQGGSHSRASSIVPVRLNHSGSGLGIESNGTGAKSAEVPELVTPTGTTATASMPPLNLSGSVLTEEPSTAQLESRFPDIAKNTSSEAPRSEGSIDQNAAFFDPSNKKAALIREQCAVDTLDELLDYILNKGGSVGILDATNSTLERRKMVMNHIREKAGKELNVLFVESWCKDETLLESNMRLKLSGPDYKDKDPILALEDFRKRVAMYEKSYVPIGDYEEDNNMPYVKMIDVGRKVVSHQIKGFLSAQAVYYLLNFNLAPRCIWITRHGESLDNVAGKIGGDADLSPAGKRYAQALNDFMSYERRDWEVRQQDRLAHSHFPPHPGDHTPPNPYFNTDDDHGTNFCVWTSMLKRSIQTGDVFNDEDYDVKQMRMLDELNAGIMEGMTYEEIRTKYAGEFQMRRKDKLHYRYPGPGGEGYLDVINRLRPVIVELERMTDHCLLITHRSVARVLLAYFLGLNRDDVARLDAPLGMVYRLEPKPYGVEFKAFRYNPANATFDYLPEFKLEREQH